MKNFVNTAKIEYTIDQRTLTAYSNTVALPFAPKGNFVSGQVLCRKDCRKWCIVIREKATNNTVFALSGYATKGFYAQLDPYRQYYISFTSDNKSTMRLYNTPSNVSVCYNFE